MTTHSASGRRNYGVTFFVLSLAGTTYALMQSLVSPALADFQRDLNTSASAVAWLISAFLVSASVLTPIVGRMGDMFGKKRTLLVTLVVLGIGSFMSAIGTSIELVVAGRAVQGIGGAIFPLAFAIIRDEFPRERVAQGIALTSGIIGIGGGAGIVLAGPIADGLGLAWLFWLPFIVVVVTIIATVLLVPESPIRAPGRINWAGGALLSAWLASGLLAISEAPTWGWTDAKTVGLLAASAILLVAWIVNEERAPAPLVDMDMMRIRGVWTVNAVAFLIGVGMYSAFLLIPEFVAAPPEVGYGFDASVTQAGLFMLPSAAIMLIASPIAGQLAGRIGSRVPLLIGCISTCASYAVLALAHDQRWEIYVGTGLMGLGVGLAFAAMANLIIEAVRPDQTGVATGMNTVLRTIGGAVGSTVCASILTASLVGGQPTEHAFTVGFAITAAAGALAALLTLAVPAPRSAAARRRVDLADAPS
jgi:EmrB/QacA subfamily drug resistance transporter